jgi:glycosyltransferase involved in cell wall biosynthesis
MRFVSGLWEGLCAERVLKAKHNERRYDAIIIYSLKRAQIRCAQYAIRQLGLPVILEYEDDAFVDIHGRLGKGLISRYHRHRSTGVLKSVSGVIAPSPYLLSQCPPHVPKLLLRAVISDEIIKFSRTDQTTKHNWVVFSGTHEGTQGLEQMIKAWRMLQLPDWQFHIAGQGPLTLELKKQAAGDPSIVFHGFLNREENAKLLCAAKIGMNPQDVTQTPGNVFAFKIVEYLAAGAHVITTPRGPLERELEAGVTYISDNSPEAIARCLARAMRNGSHPQMAQEAAIRIYGPGAVAESLNSLLFKVMSEQRHQGH